MNTPPEWSESQALQSPSAPSSLPLGHKSTETEPSTRHWLRSCSWIVEGRAHSSSWLQVSRLWPFLRSPSSLKRPWPARILLLYMQFSRSSDLHLPREQTSLLLPEWSSTSMYIPGQLPRQHLHHRTLPSWVLPLVPRRCLQWEFWTGLNARSASSETRSEMSPAFHLLLGWSESAWFCPSASAQRRCWSQRVHSSPSQTLPLYYLFWLEFSHLDMSGIKSLL